MFRRQKNFVKIQLSLPAPPSGSNGGMEFLFVYLNFSKEKSLCKFYS